MAEDEHAASVLAETNRSITAAAHLTDADAGAVATLRILARTIDETDDRWELVMERFHESGERGKPPSFDNVTIPTYLKYCEALGLTPSGRLRMTPEKEASVGGKLGGLRAFQGGRSRAAPGK